MAHHNYYLDLCVDVCVVYKNTVLLRMHDKYHNWGFPGGHIDQGEDANQAAIREVWEEVGLEVELVGPVDWQKIDTGTNRDLVPPIFVNRHSITSVHDHSAFVFAARAVSNQLAPQSPEDIAKAVECRWVTQTELDHLVATDPLMRSEIHRYASTALQLVQSRL
jgi:8-oxo-dGTP pyrophosphatase MutT (NUDIX family)